MAGYRYHHPFDHHASEGEPGPDGRSHSHDHGQSHDHEHSRGPMRLRTRRAFLGDVGGGALALALFAPLAACTSSSDSADSAAGTTAGTVADDDTEESSPTTGDEAAGDEAVDDGAAGGDVRWARTNLGFVSAYVVARGNKAAIVDTGVDGSADAIGETLADLGLVYNDVESVILTHKHGDHVGGLSEVLTRSVNANVFAGEPDLGGIAAEAAPLFGGEDVFGFEILATPGHTAGSVSAIDHGAGLLIAGDAITISAGAAAEPPAEFTSDPDGARASIAMLAQLSFNTLLIGHGDPIESGADAAVAALAATF